MQKVTVVSITEGKTASNISVTLKRGEEFARCEDMLTFEEADAEDYFDEWVACAVAGEEGYTAMWVEDNKVVMYSN